MLVQGPLHPILIRRSPLGLRAFGDDIAVGKPGTPQRVDAWITTRIHVLGKPDWIIVKVHTHGAVDAEVVLGDEMAQTFHYLETRYNDGDNYVLHYVTARELFNIIKAAEAGEEGNPTDYRDYLVAPPKYLVDYDALEASPELRSAVALTYGLERS
jgi:hypothetical protein